MEKNKKNLKIEEAYREKAPADMINEPESNEQEDTGSAVSDENNKVKSRKERKLEKKARKEERKKLHPGPFRRSFLVIKEETEGIKNLYRDMNSKERENSDEALSNDESFDISEASEEDLKITHVRGKFKILARPEPSDYYEFMIRYQISSVSGIFSVLISIAALVLTVIAIVSESSPEVIVLCFMILLLLMLVGPFNYFIKALRLSKLSASETNSKEYCFSTKGFDISSKNNEYIAFRWEDVYSVRELKKVFYIFLNPDDGMIIPKKDIEAAGRKSEQFTELLEKKCPEKINFRKIL